MRLVIVRRIKRLPQDVQYVSTISVVPDSPVYRAMDALARRPMEDLARLWSMIQGLDADRDPNLKLAALCPEWSGASLWDLLAGVSFSGMNPVVVLAVEERVRRALDAVRLVSDYEALFRNIEVVVDVPSPEASPLGTYAVPPPSS